MTLTVVDDGSRVSAPSIHGDLVVYSSDRHGDFDIFVFRLSDEQTFRVTDHPADQLLGNVFENLVAYVDYRTGADIFVNHLEIP